MFAKHLLFENARCPLVKGVSDRSKAVAVTLGPRGLNFIESSVKNCEGMRGCGLGINRDFAAERGVESLRPVLNCWENGPAVRGEELVRSSLLAAAKRVSDSDNKEKML